MKTLTISISEDAFGKIEAEARSHGVTVEQEIVRRCAPVDWRNRPLIEDRDELLRAAETFHRELAGRGICFSAEEIDHAIKEARR